VLLRLNQGSTGAADVLQQGQHHFFRRRHDFDGSVGRQLFELRRVNSMGESARAGYVPPLAPGADSDGVEKHRCETSDG
jgi:hypothetical protein